MKTTKVRASRGLGQLDVDTTLFYMQVLEADINDGDSFRGHSNYCQSHSARNLAWGQSSGSDAVNAWMSEEAEYKSFVAQHPDVASMDTFSFFMSYPSEYKNVGHFLNLTDPSLQYQGGGYGSASTRTWAWGASTYQIGTSYTTAQFRKMADAVSTRDLYRVYNPATGEHLYTTHREEVDHLVASGWRWETDQTMQVPRSSATPVWRLVNTADDDHHYTTDAWEAKVLTTQRGWRYDFGGEPAFYGAAKDQAPVYRIYDTRAARFGHLFTKDAYEKSVWLKAGGWNDEGVGWYCAR